MADAFREHFGSKPQFGCSAPGRVNIIGEHVDYSGFCVLPLAIQQSIRIFGSSTQDGRVSIVNREAEAYPAIEFDMQNWKRAEDKPGSWHHYVACGIIAVAGDENGCCDLHGKGMQLFVEGSIPKGAGLSSSSALVCAAALAAQTALDLPKKSETELANACCRAERFVGTMGGGMDQAASFLASEGEALVIHFSPELSCERLSLPPGAVFVVANSLSSSFKVRVVECRVGALLLSQKLLLQPGSHSPTLCEVKRISGLSLAELHDRACALLPHDPVSFHDAAVLLDLDVKSLAQTVGFQQDCHDLPGLKLANRVAHVLSESIRVEKFISLCRDDSAPTDRLDRLALLMSESHKSLRDDYDCSCPSLDQLVSDMNQAGCLGARMTGAGWGGCAIGLTTQDRAQEVMEELWSRYYHSCKFTRDERNQVLFQTVASGGAGYLAMD